MSIVQPSSVNLRQMSSCIDTLESISVGKRRILQHFKDSLEIESVTSVWKPVEVVCVSLRMDILEKDMNPSVPLVINK